MFYKTTLISLLATAAAVDGAPSARATSGCSVNLKPTLATPQNTGLVILEGALSKWVDSTGMQQVSSSVVNMAGATSAPYSIEFLSGEMAGYESEASLADVLDTWVGTYLVGDATPQTNDFLVTSVTCT